MRLQKSQKATYKKSLGQEKKAYRADANGEAVFFLGGGDIILFSKNIFSSTQVLGKQSRALGHLILALPKQASSQKKVVCNSDRESRATAAVV